MDWPDKARHLEEILVAFLICPLAFFDLAALMRLSGQTATVPERDYGQRGNRLAAPRVARMLWTILNNRIGMRVDLGIAARPLNGGNFLGWNMKNPSFEKEGKWHFLVMDQDGGRD